MPDCPIRLPVTHRVSRRRQTLSIQLAVACATLFAYAPAQSEPLQFREQNPLLAGAGLPTPVAARIEPDARWSTGVHFSWSNTALIQADGDEALIVDAETKELRFIARRTFGERFAVRLQIPWREVSGGSLDGFIDDWHELFGLPEGARPRLPHDDLRIEYMTELTRAFYVGDAARGFGDATVELGYALARGQRGAASAWLALELPTGDEAKLTGNGRLDVSLVLAGERSLSERWSMYGQAGASWLGDSGFQPDRQRTLVWSGLAGVSWRALDAVALKAQVAAHTAPYDSRLDFLSEGVALTLGAEVRLSSGWRIDLGISEDVVVERAPDVVFLLGVSRSSGAR